MVSNFTSDVSNNVYVYAASFDGSVYSTSSISPSWTQDQHLTSSGITSLVADPLNIGTVYIVAFVPTSAFVAKVNNAGNTFSYSTYLGGIGTTAGWGVATRGSEPSEQTYVTGNTSGQGFPITSPFLLPSSQTDTFATIIADTSATCTYAVNPGSSTATGSGQAIFLGVVAPSGCGWTVTGNPSWTFVSPTAGSGTGVVSVFVSGNSSGSTRSGTVQIVPTSGTTVLATITQADSSCGFGFDQSPYLVPAAGGSVTANLNTGSGCAWAVQNTAPASIQINSGASGTGGGAISLGVAPNNDLNSRNFALPVGNNVINITQFGTCVYTLASNSANNVPAAGVSNTSAHLYDQRAGLQHISPGLQQPVLGSSILYIE